MEPVRAGVSEPTTFSIVDFIEQGFRDLDKAHEGLDKYNASQSFLKPENFTEDMDLDPKDFIFEAIAALDDFNLHLSRAIAFLHTTVLLQHSSSTPKSFLQCDRTLPIFRTTLMHK